MSSPPGSPSTSLAGPHVRWMDEIDGSDALEVGAKCASLGAVHRAAREGRLGAARIPDGFVITCAATEAMFAAEGVQDRLRSLMDQVHRGELTAHQGGHAARETILGLQVPADLRRQIAAAWTRLDTDPSAQGPTLLAVRSSAVSEDLPGASFAGQYDSHLGVHGLDQLLDAYRSVLASLFTDRVIDYRRHLDVEGSVHLDLAMAVGVQRLVRADLGGCAGVLFTSDPESPAGGAGRVVIEAVRGLGDSLVGGSADPARYLVARPTADAAEPDRYVPVSSPSGPDADLDSVLDASSLDTLTRAGLALERRLGHALDIEWAIDGRTGELFLLQARPITGVRGGTPNAPTDRSSAASAAAGAGAGAGAASVLTTGLGIGAGEVTAPVCVLDDPLDADAFEDGSILVTPFTDPSWMHLMRRSAGLVTDHGGRTSHAAIVARELGLLAVLGCQDATSVLAGVSTATLRCAGDGTGEVRPATIS